MKNTSKVESTEFETIMIAQTNSDQIEEEVIAEHRGQNTFIGDEQYLSFVTSLLNTLTTTKREGETVTDFLRRVDEEMDQTFAVSKESL